MPLIANCWEIDTTSWSTAKLWTCHCVVTAQSYSVVPFARACCRFCISQWVSESHCASCALQQSPLREGAQLLREENLVAQAVPCNSPTSRKCTAGQVGLMTQSACGKLSFEGVERQKGTMFGYLTTVVSWRNLLAGEIEFRWGVTSNCNWVLILADHRRVTESACGKVSFEGAEHRTGTVFDTFGTFFKIQKVII